jgi:2-keto-4-pentenoate hydratase/2-oxohepta-3-ene-1,7-dioic acid hydratase in catechol pathway
MRLVTYDREGARRLGAWVEDSVVDLPDAVGHPVFPSTMEGLVARNGGTTLDAARDALSAGGALAEFTVHRPRLLSPLDPESFERPRDDFPGRRHGPVAGPGQSLGVPPSATASRWTPQVVCVIGRRGRDLSLPEAARAIFGYTLATEWAYRDAGGEERGGVALGPSIVTPDELDLPGIELTARVDGVLRWRAALATGGEAFAGAVAEASRRRELLPGTVCAPAAGKSLVPKSLSRYLRPGAALEVHAGGIGTLRNRW